MFQSLKHTPQPPPPPPPSSFKSYRVCPGYWGKAAPCSKPKNRELQRKKLRGALATLPHAASAASSGPAPLWEERTPWGGKQGSGALGHLAGEEFKASFFKSDLEPDLQSHFRNPQMGCQLGVSMGLGNCQAAQCFLPAVHRA